MIKNFEGLGEKEIVRQICEEFNLLCDQVRESVARTEILFADNPDYLSSKQIEKFRYRLVNAHLANRIRGNNILPGWKLDGSGFLHLTHMLTGANISYRAVDPLTRKQPKAGNTFSSQARYTQGGSLEASEMPINVFDYPDLTGVNLLLACDYAALDSVFLRVYKPLEPGTYGSAGKVAYSFPIFPTPGTRWGDADTPFIPDMGDEDILSSLLEEERVK